MYYHNYNKIYNNNKKCIIIEIVIRKQNIGWKDTLERMNYSKDFLIANKIAKVSLLPVIKADFNGTFPFRGTYLLSRTANTIHNGPNTRSKLLAMVAGMCAQKANRAESTLTRGDSHRKNRRSKPSEITLAGRRGCS